jgi:hypothetical protein
MFVNKRRLLRFFSGRPANHTLAQTSAHIRSRLAADLA